MFFSRLTAQVEKILTQQIENVVNSPKKERRREKSIFLCVSLRSLRLRVKYVLRFTSQSHIVQAGEIALACRQ